MRSRAAFWTPLLLVLVLGVAVLFLFEKRTLGWLIIQEEYQALDPGFRPGTRAKTLVHAVTGTSSKKEYCTTCHLGMAGYKPREGTVFGSHCDVYHEVIEFDCVVCHKGDPDSLEKCMDARYGIDRPLKGAAAWSSCLHCHDPGAWPKELARYPGASRAKHEIEAAMTTFGCVGCHQLVNRGGVIGPSLTELGRERMSDLTGRYATVYDRIEDKIKNSRASSPSSIMPVTGLQQESLVLIASYLSLNGVAPYSPTRWNIAGEVKARPGGPSGEETYGHFCSGCHNRLGEGRERGDNNPYGVPTLSSKLFAHYVERAYLTRAIAVGKAGTMMEGFRKGHYDGDGAARNILSAGELESLASFIQSGAFATYGARFDEVAVASCPACHVTQKRVYASMTSRQKVSYFKRHPRRYSIERMCGFEKIVYPPAAERVEKGKELYRKLCMHCHDAPEDRERASREISAPRIDRYFEAPGFEDSFFLMNVMCGRGDGAKNKWRHMGVSKREYAIEEIVAVVHYLRSTHE